MHKNKEMERPGGLADRMALQLPQSLRNILLLDHQPARKGPDRAFDRAHMGIENRGLDPGLGQDMGGIGEQHQVVRPQYFFHAPSSFPRWRGEGGAQRRMGVVQRVTLEKSAK